MCHILWWVVISIFALLATMGLLASNFAASFYRDYKREYVYQLACISQKDKRRRLFGTFTKFFFYFGLLAGYYARFGIEYVSGYGWAFLAILFLINLYELITILIPRYGEAVFDKKGLRIRKKKLAWENIAQVRFDKTPITPGKRQHFGVFYFAGKAMAQAEWDTLACPCSDVVDVLAKTKEDALKILECVRIQEERWVEPPVQAMLPRYGDSPGMVGIKSEGGWFWAISAKRLLLASTFPFFMIFGILSLVFPPVNEHDAYFSEQVLLLGLAIGTGLCTAFVLAVSGLYRISERGIEKYVFPFVRLRTTKWEDIVLAGYGGGGMLCAFTQAQKIPVSSMGFTGLIYKPDVALYTLGYHPRIATLMAHYLPKEVWEE